MQQKSKIYPFASIVPIAMPSGNETAYETMRKMGDASYLLDAILIYVELVASQFKPFSVR